MLELTKRPPNRWKPGESGNPAGRAVGSRNRFSEAFVGDIAASWAKHDAAVLERLVVDDPAKYADICSRLIPRDVALTVEQRLPGGLDRADLEILQAIKAAIPDAGAREPQEVFNLALDALKSYLAIPSVIMRV
jgi:hypothetical protein